MIRVEHLAHTPFNRGEILRYAACKEENEAVSALYEECIKEAKPLLSYRVCSTVLPVYHQEDALFIGTIQTASQTLKRALSQCEEAVLFAATIGIELDRLITRYGQISPAKALFFQAIGAERIESLCNAFTALLKQELCGRGKHLKTRVSPGYGDIALVMQQEIFALLDCPRKIGLTLSENMIMSPSKSVTAFAGITAAEPSQNSENGCMNCLKTNCDYNRYRKGSAL